MNSSKCPICNSRSVPLFSIYEYNISACHCCSHRFCTLKVPKGHVAEQYSDQYFFGGGVGYPDYLAEKELRIAQGRNYADLIASYRPHNPHPSYFTMLDIGCAAGFITKGFADKGWLPIGIEPNESMVYYAQDTLGLQAYVSDLENADQLEELAPMIGHVELVSIIQVIAHVIDLKKSFKTIDRFLRPNGLLLIETWDCNSTTARILGKHWHEYSPPNVLNYFSRQSLNHLTSQYGFTEVAHGRPQKRLTANLAQSLLFFKYGNRGLGRFFQKVMAIIPRTISLPYPGDDLFWTLYRKE